MALTYDTKNITRPAGTFFMYTHMTDPQYPTRVTCATIDYVISGSSNNTAAKIVNFYNQSRLPYFRDTVSVSALVSQEGCAASATSVTTISPQEEYYTFQPITIPPITLASNGKIATLLDIDIKYGNAVEGGYFSMGDFARYSAHNWALDETSEKRCPTAEDFLTTVANAEMWANSNNCGEEGDYTYPTVYDDDYNIYTFDDVGNIGEDGQVLMRLSGIDMGFSPISPVNPYIPIFIKVRIINNSGSKYEAPIYFSQYPNSAYDAIPYFYREEFCDDNGYPQTLYLGDGLGIPTGTTDLYIPFSASSESYFRKDILSTITGTYKLTVDSKSVSKYLGYPTTGNIDTGTYTISSNLIVEGIDGADDLLKLLLLNRYRGYAYYQDMGTIILNGATQMYNYYAKIVPRINGDASNAIGTIIRYYSDANRTNLLTQYSYNGTTSQFCVYTTSASTAPTIYYTAVNSSLGTKTGSVVGNTSSSATSAYADYTQTSVEVVNYALFIDETLFSSSFKEFITWQVYDNISGFNGNYWGAFTLTPVVVGDTNNGASSPSVWVVAKVNSDGVLEYDEEFGYASSLDEASSPEIDGTIIRGSCSIPSTATNLTFRIAEATNGSDALYDFYEGSTYDVDIASHLGQTFTIPRTAFNNSAIVSLGNYGTI